MNSYRIVWEDEAKAREIELFADYACEAGVVEVRAIYARRVTFYDPESRKPIRTVAVHTSSGSDLLVRQYLAAREEAITTPRKFGSNWISAIPASPLRWPNSRRPIRSTPPPRQFAEAFFWGQQS